LSKFKIIKFQQHKNQPSFKKTKIHFSKPNQSQFHIKKKKNQQNIKKKHFQNQPNSKKTIQSKNQKQKKKKKQKTK